MIVVCGEVVLDVLRDQAPSNGPGPVRFVGHPGGSPANTAVAIARLGSEVRLCARLARTSVGALLREHLVANGVDLAYAVRAEEAASLAFVDVGDGGVAEYSFYVEGTADWQWSDAELPVDMPSSVRMLHAGSIAAALEPGRTAIVGWLARERRDRMLSFDPNVRPALFGDRDRARIRVEELVAAVDLVKVSDEDLTWLCPGESVDSATARWLDLGASLVIVTSGARGARGTTRSGTVTRPAVPVEVVDTVGAGDSYAAALLHWLDRESLGHAVSSGTLSSEALGAGLDFAAAAASITCGRAGADPPTAAEVTGVLVAQEQR